MRLFDDYLHGLDDVLSKKTSLTPSMINERRRFKAEFNKSEVTNTALSEDQPQLLNGPKILFNYDRQFIENKFGINSHAFSDITIGPHPDFKEILEEESYLYHHCVSMFVDIKGSTRLIEKYSLLEVRLIKDSLLSLAINLANQLGGHVHRLQGDGIFLQFVRRNAVENDALINALNTASLLTQFVINDLSEIMKQHDLRPLKVRVGIDFGKASDVLWSYYGIPNCNELTTTSVHTDMAAKLQAKANDNSILIGGNVKDRLDLKNEFISIYESEESKEKVYYISSAFTYPFYVFNWQEYLLSLPYIGKASNGKLEVKETRIHIMCLISDENGDNTQRYYPNSKSIAKGKSIKYLLTVNDQPYVKQAFETIEWYAHNSGKEAEGLHLHDFGKKYNNSTVCETTAAYLGHHYVECRITKQHSTNERITFPIFVQ